MIDKNYKYIHDCIECLIFNAFSWSNRLYNNSFKILTLFFLSQSNKYITFTFFSHLSFFNM